MPAKGEMRKETPAVITYLNKNCEKPEADLLVYKLYKAGVKKPAHENLATICYIQLPLERIFNRYVKKATDVFLSVIVIAGILSWLIPVMAIIIKLTSPGPVFFLQKRSKKNGGIFTCIKFRTMVVNDMADILPAEDNDKRITVVGRFMRKTFIDELPQFFNVLLGDMSVIGPRPHMLNEHLKFESLVPHYKFRNTVKPGITGLSQVAGLQGPANTIMKMNSRVTVDNIYIRNWSLKLDILIIFRTISKLFGAK